MENVLFAQEAESAVLGAMLKSETLRATVLESVVEEDFYIPGHRLIFRTANLVHSQGKPCDIVTVGTYLVDHGTADDAGGLDYVADLPRAIPLVSHLGRYIEIVKEKSTLRKLVAACEEITALATSGEHELDYVLAEAERKVFDVSQQNIKRSLRIITEDVMKCFDDVTMPKEISGVTGIATGFVELDKLLSGLHRSDLIIVAARPGMGKTSFAMNIAQYASTMKDAVTAIFSLEMSRDQLILRLMSAQSRVDMELLKKGLAQVEPSNVKQLAQAVTDFCHGPAQIYIDDTAGITVAEIMSKLRRLKIEVKGLDLVVIDYLQLMQYRGKAQNRQQEVAETTRALKIMARDLDVPVVLISQLSRAPQQRADHKPVMSDLRESGAIEQDADVIVMLYNPNTQPNAEIPEGEENLADIIVAKHRNGSTGTFKMFWRGQYTRFENKTDLEASPWN